MRVLQVFLLSFALLGAGGVRAALPTIDEVYAAVNAGQLAQAQRMLDEVLAAKPDSAKAHFVQAELHAARNQMAAARSELEKAEQLKPGLPFVKHDTLQSLKRQIGLEGEAARPASGGLQISKGALTVGTVLVVAFILFMAANRRAQRAAPGYTGVVQGPVGPHGATTGAGNGQPYGPGSAAYGPGYGQPYGQGASGMGSRVLGGLATGAAVGAGIVAGEALMGRALHEGEHPTAADAQATLQDDTVIASGGLDAPFGGNDFGISDAGSWDDAGGSDDWS